MGVAAGWAAMPGEVVVALRVGDYAVERRRRVDWPDDPLLDVA